MDWLETILNILKKLFGIKTSVDKKKALDAHIKTKEAEADAAHKERVEPLEEEKKEVAKETEELLSRDPTKKEADDFIDGAKKLPVLMLALALFIAPLPVRAQQDPCPDDVPGYECYSKKDLWTAGVKYRGAWKQCTLDLRMSDSAVERDQEKLAVRTSTATVEIAEGVSWELTVSIGLLALAVGGLVGALVAGGDEPPEVIVQLIDRLPQP